MNGLPRDGVAVRARRLVGVAVLAGCLLGLVVRGGPATADDTFAPPLGIDVPTASAVEVKFTEGDFAGTTMTVSQTRELGNQGITIAWKGAPPTPPETLGQNVFSLMQCWGDPDAADPAPHVPGRPDPFWARETCQFGSLLETPLWGDANAPGGGTIRNVGIGARPDPKETLPPDAVIAPFRSVKGDRIGSGGPSDPYPDGMSSQTGSDVVMARFFDKYKTNEVPYGFTAGDGTGRVVFEAQTDVQAPYLGCGLPDPAGVIRPCWLVIVPRGHHDPLDGRNLTGTGLPVNGSPLTASLWQHRVKVRLDFRSVNTPCGIGQSERATIGSEMIAPAMRAWQPALCTRQGGTVYGYTPNGDDVTAAQLRLPDEDAPGLGFTSSPAAARTGGPPLVHAPVALSSVVIAFSIDHQLDPGADAGAAARLRAKQVNGLRLTPKLVAKLLTASYQRDVPGGDTAPHLQHNYRTILADPEFRAINPDFVLSKLNRDIQPLMLPLNGSAANRAVWAWVLADKAARDFLAGVPDPEVKDDRTGRVYRMVVNTYYKGLGLEGPVPDRFPKADTTCTQPNKELVPELQSCLLNKAPYTASMTAGAQQTLRADTRSEVEFDMQKWIDSNKQVVTLKRADPQQPGNRWVMAITDSASAARFGLYSASLLNGTNPADPGQYIAPTRQSLLAAVGAMQPTSNPDVLALDPAVHRPGAYPLTMLTYAAVDPSRSAAAREDYARFVEYAAGDGQREGDNVGDLPPGYVPLPDDLRAKARSAAVAIRRGWTPPATTEPAAAPPGTSGTVPANGSVPSAAPPSPRPSGSTVAVPVAQATPGDPVGWLQRYLLSIVLGAGLLALTVGRIAVVYARHRGRSG
ncbi:hypothetical protein Dfulv_28705 [Dactylosporangium fulvum]|uniref:PBP domain-containing protein n=1 Tax=Dactylosporangium fulvum TaxID=53359 RepID=A0ABY5VPW6_9ACTN|nr:hypothetical protein [Dactylosporangium fulvum]UWP79144.1 hypothetical protein Dfulv_28705 [Dactylosporangium fulvum]